MKKKIVISVLGISFLLVGSYFLMDKVLKEKEERKTEEKVEQEKSENFEFDKEKLAEYLRENSIFLSKVFSTFHTSNVEKNYQETQSELDFIRAYDIEYFEARTITKDGNLYMKEEDIKKYSKRFFGEELEVDAALRMEDYYSLGSETDGGAPLYFPVLHKLESLEEEKYKIILIDYRSIDENLENYENTLEVNNIGNASTLEIVVKIENEKIKIVYANFTYKEDLSIYDSVEHRNKYLEKVKMSNDGKYEKDLFTNKESLANFLRNNGGLLGALFETYRKENYEMKNDIEDQKRMIRTIINHREIDNSKIYYNETDRQPTSNLYVKKELIREIGNEFFENFDESKIETLENIGGNYVKLGTEPYREYFEYYPILLDAEYKDDENTYTLRIINYKDIGNIEEYWKKMEVTKKELKEKNITNLPVLEITYKSQENQRYLVSSKFIVQQKVM